MITKHLSVIVYIIGIFVCSAQENNFIRGKILDKETKEPVVFATVRILGMAKGVVTNMDGSFRLPMDFRENGRSIEISSMGYQKKRYELQNLSPKDINIIYLAEGVLSLTEAVVNAKRPKRISAAKIVRRAIKAIPENYPIQPFTGIGYYRDFQLKNGDYVNLNEAILEVSDQGFSTNDNLSTVIRMYDYRSNEDFEKDFEGRFKYDYQNYQKYIDKAYLFNYGGNEFTILRIHDAIRNYRFNSFDFVNVMQRDFVGNHFFKREDDILLGQEPLYVISFTKILLNYRVLGKIYISKRNYEIYKLEYTLYDKTRLVENKPLDNNGSSNVVLFKVVSEYNKYLGRMYPGYISFFNTFQVNKPPKFILEETIVDLDCKCFLLSFNNLVDPVYARVKKHYDFRFKGKKLQIEKIRIDSDFESVVKVYPDLSESELRNLAFELKTKEEKRLAASDLLTIEVTGIRDLTPQANLINDMNYKTYEQFREFFVQEIKPSIGQQKDSLFMKKDRPLFEDQPIKRPRNFNDYWMNTPLPKLSN